MSHILVETKLITLGMSKLYTGIWYVVKPSTKGKPWQPPNILDRNEFSFVPSG